MDASHWESILEDIREVREHLSPANTSPSYGESRGESVDPPGQPDAGFLFGTAADTSIQQILSILPSQPICDMLLSWFFNARFMNLGKSQMHTSRVCSDIRRHGTSGQVSERGEVQDILARPAIFLTNLLQYKAFWESPTTAPPLWIGLLFSILSVTVTLRKFANPGADTTSVPTAEVLQNATVQCLVLGKYATANNFALETFMLHLQSCFLTRGREPVDFWFGMGVIIRLAFRCGYHRDPSTLANLSLFDGEMRRRVWLNIVQIDALMSFQMGFPSMIPSQFCDTKDPLNLQHADLRMDMTELPVPRPLTETTPVSYLIVKSSVMKVFRKIVESTQSLTVPPYSETAALNAEIRRVYSELPEQYQPRDIGYAFTDAAVLILERCTIELLYLKGIIVLLRQFISYDQDESIHASLRHECVDAALSILSRQAEINKACEPGGRLGEDRWIMASLAPSDFLLAAMVVCRHLSVTMSSRRVPSAEDREFAQRQYTALQTAHRIFSLQAGQSRDMRLATEAIDLMLRKVAEKDHGALVVEPPSANADKYAMEGLQQWHADSISQMIDGSDDWVSHFYTDIDVRVY